VCVRTYVCSVCVEGGGGGASMRVIRSSTHEKRGQNEPSRVDGRLHVIMCARVRIFK